MNPTPEEKALNFDQIIQNSCEGILIVDAAGLIRFANPAAYRLLSHQGDLIDKSFGQPLKDDKAVELGIMRLNEKMGIGEMRITETIWQGEKASLVLLLDITELKYAQDDLQKINDQLELRVKERTAEILRYVEELKGSNERLFSANKELEQFAYVASHDLQEPLRKITTYGDRLVDYKFTDPKYKDYLVRMTKAALGMSHLVESLLEFSRFPDELSMEVCDLGEVIQDVIDALEVKIEQTGTTVQFKNLPKVQANKAQMSHLFQNLIENSIKFTRKGIAPLILLESVPENDENVVISIKDNGIGIDEQYFEVVFMPFKRLHARSEYEGAGIGLSIVKKIADNHKGSVRITSVVNEGSVFILTLPVVRDLSESTS